MKAAIYIRTSSKDQHPELQQEQCEQLARARGYDVEGVCLEKLSAWADIERPQYEAIKEKARRGEIQAVVVWALDRWVRNRDTLIEDVTILRNFGCKLHSVKDAWLEAVNIEGPMGKTIQEFLLGMLGSQAEMESQRKSERVKLAVRRSPGTATKSYKGNRWGRKPLSQNTVDAVHKLRAEGLSVRAIAGRVTYTDKNNHQKRISPSAVHKLLSEK